MPRYFFDTHDGVEEIDRAGSEWPDLAAVRARALDLAGAHTKRSGMRGADGSAIVVTVRDETGETAIIVRLVCSIENGGRHP